MSGSRQAASQPHQAVLLDDFDLSLIGHQSAAACRLHGDTVEHVQTNELLQFDGRDNPFIHQDRQSALAFQCLVAGDLIRANRGFQNVDTDSRPVVEPTSSAVCGS